MSLFVRSCGPLSQVCRAPQHLSRSRLHRHSPSEDTPPEASLLPAPFTRETRPGGGYIACGNAVLRLRMRHCLLQIMYKQEQRATERQRRAKATEGERAGESGKQQAQAAHTISCIYTSINTYTSRVSPLSPPLLPRVLIQSTRARAMQPSSAQLTPFPPKTLHT